MKLCPPRRWRDLKPPFADTDRSSWITVLPLGACEQHGPHLPPETDTIIANGIVDATIDAMPDELPVTFLPTEEVGYSIEHLDLGGTRTLSWDEAVRRWIGIAEMLHEFGIRKFVMLNAHGGNSPLMTIVATEVRIRLRMLAVATGWTRFGIPSGSISGEEKAYGIHAGEIETSVMLALRPDLVDMTRATAFASFQQRLASEARHLRAYGPHAFGWSMRDLNPSGAVGDAKAASAETGRRLIRHAVGGFVELLRDVDRFDPGHFD